jgi:perosamine synthetase
MKRNDSKKTRNEIPFFKPWITKDDKKAVLDALNNSLLTDGPILRKFENKFAKFTNAKYAIGVSNATSALFLTLKALKIGKGDEVIVPDLTFVATANAVLQTGATPVFADVEKNSINISTKSIIKCINSRTKVIIPVHFAGRICEIKDIKKIADKNNLFVIEDCAHAIGAKLNKKHVGNFGNAGCFSFYPTKNITTLEGGMVITNSKQIADYITRTRNHGLTKTLSQRYSKGKPWDYDMSELGYNFRLDEIRSALGLSQLKRIKKLNILRRRKYEYYNKKLENINGIITPKSTSKEDHVFHLYIMRIEKNDKISRDKLFEKLLGFGIKTSVHYKPLHKFSTLKKFSKNKEFVNSNKLYDEMITLPFYPNMAKKDQDYIIMVITKIMNDDSNN